MRVDPTTLTGEDFDELGRKIYDVQRILIALYDLAMQYQNGVSGDTLSTITEQLSNRGMQVLDRVLEGIGQSQLGDYESA